ncbi:putative ribosomal protein S21 [Medicago truncatula]|uniref:Ribosomal protein S21 n=1 Tax=Medicago truncatula TaxID=3880 RepID=G7JMN6_MEDTR|nr:30S ribosomal protein S21, chloroplastic isoform X2 [Medicago truncatula]AES91096.1 ribosomal protein S21 [Medicago truncatula]RHN63408.1 putative ribosomal protein S21 [Medicago truncatula]
MAVWSLRPKTCPCPSSPSPLQSSSGFTTTNFGHVSFSTIAYPTLSVKYYVNVQINIVDDDEPEDELINRFRKEVIMAGVFQECRRRRFFETPQDKIKRKAREASKRNRKRRPYIPPARDKYEYDYPNKKKDDDGEEEDNWELLDVDVPYS